MTAVTPTWFMMISFIALLLILPLVGLVLASLFHHRTRPVGLMLLVAGVVGIGLVMSTLWLRASHHAVVADYGVTPMHQVFPDHHQIQHIEFHDTGFQHSTSKSWGIGFVGAPLLLAVALVVVGLIKYRAAALPVIGLFVLGLFGFYFVSWQPVERVPGMVTAEVSLPAPSPSVVYDQAGQEAFEEVYGHVLEEAIPVSKDLPAAPSAPAPPLTPEAPADEQTTPIDELPTWAEAFEPEVSPLPPVAAVPASVDVNPVKDSPADQSPLEAMAASEGVDRAQLQLALDPDAAPAPAPPEWTRQPHERVGNVVRRVVSEGPHATADVAYERVQAKIGEAVHEYLREVVAEEMHSSVAVPQLHELGITPRWIRDNVVAEHYYASTDTSVASDMQTIFVRLEFTPRVTDTLVEAWQVDARQGRVSTVALAGSGLLAAMAGVWGLIKLDTATKGYYTKRLFIGVPLAIIGGLTLLGLIVA